MTGIGTRIQNTISDGDGESDLYLTFTCAWNFPDVKEGSPEEAEKTEQFSKQGREAVMKTIEQIRELVQQGVVKA